ncbi:hypothetical protein MMC25_001764 [Agyrium rufum]|nr:hypothetical protein [Agyrium rufum]
MELPTFDASALSGLAKNIEKNLKGPEKNLKGPEKNIKGLAKKTTKPPLQQRTQKDVPRTGAQKRLRDGTPKKAEVPQPKPRVNGDVGKERRNRVEKDQKPTQSGQRNYGRGAANGVKKQTESSDPINSIPLSKQPRIRTSFAGNPPSNGVGADRTALIQEVLALGGTEEDLDLLDGAASESEVEGIAEETSATQLQSGLQQLVKELGFGSTQAQNGASEEEVEKEWADTESDAEDVVEISTKSKEKEAAKAAETSPKVTLKQSNDKAATTKDSRYIFMPLSEWHSITLPEIPVPSQTSMPNTDVIDELHKHATQLLEKENELYQKLTKSGSSSHQFYNTIMTSGTLSDKISALTLSIQESPLHNVKALENLLNLSKKRSRGQAVDVLGALKDLMGPGNLLPSDRKLRFFSSQPALAYLLGPKARWKIGEPLPPRLKEIHLVAWAFEDKLKAMYFEMLKVLETWCNDEVVFARGKAVDYVYELLRDKPEQEANLLRLLVNKLGDSDKKTASKTSYNILQLMTTHPFMKPTIISAVESDILFRPRQALHAKYYAIITLNQTVLSGKEEAVAKKLLDIYFTMFVNLLAKPTEIKTIPINLPYNTKGEKQGGGGKAGKKALEKQAARDAQEKQVDEALKEKLISAVLTGVNRAIPFTSTDDEVFEKHLDTLFRITHSSNFNTSMQALLLIQQLCATHQAASTRFYRTLYEALLDPRLLISSKQAMFLNLLFRALRADLSIKRVKAFAKRLLQVVAMHQASFTCGVIFLIKELEDVFASLKNYVDEPEEDESDAEEHFQDVDGVEQPQVPERARLKEAAEKMRPKGYDGKKRDPEFSDADASCLWEIDPFLRHYHPSVSLLAHNLLEHQSIIAKPDLSSHTLIQFLDRFVYKNPKKITTGLKGSSIMQPLASNDASSQLLSAGKTAKPQRAPLNSESFWKMSGEKVNPDEVFFHRYFNAIGKGKDVKSKKAEEKRRKDGGDGSEEGKGEDEAEEEIWKALVDSQPELEGVADSDDDLGLEDLESEFEASDVEEGSAVDRAAAQKCLDVEDEDLGDSDDAGFGISDAEDDLLGSDEEVDGDLDLDDAFEAELQTTSSLNKDPAQADKEKKKTDRKDARAKKRKLKHLPTFASADDYVKMLEGDDDDDGQY